jgi:hypothetical protein
MSKYSFFAVFAAVYTFRIVNYSFGRLFRLSLLAFCRPCLIPLLQKSSNMPFHPGRGAGFQKKTFHNFYERRID